MSFASEVFDALGNDISKMKRIRVLVIINDGSSEDRMESAAETLRKNGVKISAVCVKPYQKESHMIITRDPASLFLLDDQEAIGQWIFKQRYEQRETI